MSSVESRRSQPTGPSQSCVVTRGSGTVGAADVTDVAVTCTTRSFTVGGTVSGLAGGSLVLQNNGADNLVQNADGVFSFAAPVLSGMPYAVTVQTQPSGPSQTCTVSAGSGTVINGNVVTVAINCAVNSFTIGGTVSGLVGTGLQLQNNGGDALTINGDGGFSFATPVVSQGLYAVTVRTQPTNPSQICTVSNGAGSVGGANVSNVTVACETSRFRLGGTVTGLGAGQSVTLASNGQSLQVDANGVFQLPDPIASGSNYAVTASGQGAFCTVNSGSGTITNADVSSVQISCQSSVVVVAGLSWYWNPNACGEPCNAVCGGHGRTPANDATVFAAQDTAEECSALSTALGLGGVFNMASYTYACLEDSPGPHTAPGGLNDPLLCSTFSSCPANHRASMDQMGQACGPNSRRSICACQ